MLKIGRIWRNHVTQVLTISYSAVCRTSSCFEQHVAIFLPVDGAPELFFQAEGSETKLRMRIKINFTEAIMATEEEGSLMDLAGKLSQALMSSLPLRSILIAETYISKYGDCL